MNLIDTTDDKKHTILLNKKQMLQCFDHRKSMSYHILGVRYFGDVQDHNRDRLVHCCYRYEFPSIGGFTDDVGWGCTVRSFQMLLGNTIQRTIGRSHLDCITDEFACTFSFQNIVQKGTDRYGKTVGDWFAPSEVANCFHDIWSENEKEQFGFRFCMYGKDVLNDNSFPCLLVVPITLGVEKVNPLYHKTIVDFLRHPNSMGMVGGKRSSSYYLIGTTQSGKILYLDPHILRHHNDTNKTPNTIYAIDVDSLNPSVAFAFLVHDVTALKNIEKEFNLILSTIDTTTNRNDNDYICIEENHSDYCVIVEASNRADLTEPVEPLEASCHVIENMS
jgi:hypothetical protein